MKHDIILFIKSYKPDFKNVLNLLESIAKHNKDKIPVFLSVNDEDFLFFEKNISFNVNLLKDSDVVNCKIEDKWRYQQIVKSSVHKLNVCDAYLALDSDSEFITDFYKKDFLYKKGIPYTVMHESKGFQETMERINIDSNALFYKEATRATRTLLSIKDTSKIWDYGPSPYLWSTSVWQEIENFLEGEGKTLERFLMEISSITSPSENVIYGEYLRVFKPMEIIPIGPLFKVYHYEKQYALERKFHKLEKLEKVYLGVIFQSNWKRSFWHNFF